MLSRLALRLATVEALAPTARVLANAGPWPTLAQNRVFDSRDMPIDDLTPGDARPVICVYTEDDDGNAGQTRGGPPFLMTVDLIFEISLPLKVVEGNNPTVFVVSDPITTPQLEAGLDFLSAQIFFVLLYADAGAIWRNVCGRRVHNPRSTVHRTSEEGVRLARRTMTWKVEIEGDRYDPAPATTPTGLAILPHPLRDVAAALPSGGYGARIVAGLIAETTAPVMPDAVPLDTVGLNVTVEPPGVMPSAPGVPGNPNIVGEVDNLED
jgi:hypothetical protein